MIKKIDQIRDEIASGQVETRWDIKDHQVLNPNDPERPYCITCARNFINKKDFESHKRHKDHKKRLKRIKYDEDFERKIQKQQEESWRNLGFKLKTIDGCLKLVPLPKNNDNAKLKAVKRESMQGNLQMKEDTDDDEGMFAV
eukprot:CAMPEP_0170180312 /NCGR_PEP_ID=MMETSP0040_2-20121228/21490_1 /TAXON_ID=641309 /ORGANISM="Lotharella oceanica, Strain CCMP622" /LENGTH=141 /DNA_ID=CAMNT_0010424895 /DNA_START=186 /DNA_END=611 /DNA_ORIENTATION=+